MSGLSTEVKIQNNTQFALQFWEERIEHGRWVELPYGNIGHGEISSFKAGSDGMLTGDQGYVKYVICDSEYPNNTVEISFNNPYALPSSFNGSATKPYQLTWDKDHIQDANATINCTLTLP